MNKKKSVSFSDSTTVKVEVPEKYKVVWSLKLIPIHILVIVYYIFQQEFNEETLIKSCYSLFFTQLIYTYIFMNSIINLKNNKKVKFDIFNNYNNLIFGVIGILIESFILFIIINLFGAPFNLLKENLFLSIELSILLFPSVILLIKLGINQISIKIFLCVFIGCWLSCIAIPLDWDRPWQTWPFPIVGGGYLGASIGYVGSSLM